MAFLLRFGYRADQYRFDLFVFVGIAPAYFEIPI